MTTTDEKTIWRFVQAYNAFDVPTMVSLVHPEIRFTNISSGVVDVQTDGREEFERLARQSVALFTEREQKILSINVVEEKFLVNVFYRAVLNADLLPGLKKGDAIELSGTSEYAFKDGLIVSIVDES